MLHLKRYVDERNYFCTKNKCDWLSLVGCLAVRTTISVCRRKECIESKNGIRGTLGNFPIQRAMGKGQPTEHIVLVFIR